MKVGVEKHSYPFNTIDKLGIHLAEIHQKLFSGYRNDIGKLQYGTLSKIIMLHALIQLKGCKCGSKALATNLSKTSAVPPPTMVQRFNILLHVIAAIAVTRSPLNSNVLAIGVLPLKLYANFRFFDLSCLNVFHQ